MKTLPRSKSSCGIAYHESGEGKPILFLHGVGLCADVWFPQIEVFDPVFRIIVPDLPGHGESDQLTEESPTVAHYTDRIAEFLKEVVVSPAIIIGHSLGALISLDLAARYPSLCHGIAALSPIFRRSHVAQLAVQQRARELSLNKLDSSVEAPIKRWFGEAPRGRNLELAQFCRSCLTRVDHHGYAQAYSAFAESDGPDEQALVSMQIPTLFLSAEQDQNSTTEMCRSLANRVVDSIAVTVSNARHMVPLSHPDEVNAALMQLIERCEFAAIPIRTISAGVKQ